MNNKKESDLYKALDRLEEQVKTMQETISSMKKKYVLDSMPKCMFCGTIYMGDHTYCLDCTKYLEKKQTSQKYEYPNCPECGAHDFGLRNYCIHCLRKDKNVKIVIGDEWYKLTQIEQVNFTGILVLDSGEQHYYKNGIFVGVIDDWYRKMITTDK